MSPEFASASVIRSSERLFGEVRSLRGPQHGTRCRIGNGPGLLTFG